MKNSVAYLSLSTGSRSGTCMYSAACLLGTFPALRNVDRTEAGTMETFKAPRTHQEFMTEYPRTTADSLAGQMLRHYWHPVCFSRELKDVPSGVRLLGEDLVAF